MRSVLWYLAFVGLPFVGLLGILRVGERLQPPRAVHGRYAISFDSLGTGSCFAAVVDSSEHNITVSQSGPRVEIALGELEFAGVVTGDSVHVAAVTDKVALRGRNCLTADTVRIVARLVRDGTDVRLPGELRFPGCTACAPATFRAIRVASRARESSH